MIDCGAGFDRAFIRSGDVAVNCERVRSVTGHAVPHRGSFQKGTRGDDTLTGTEGRDIIFALGGNDTVNGLGGADFLFGMRGNDTVNGDAGNDRLWGGPDNDTVNGGDGNDWIHAGYGVDAVNAGNGDDLVWAAADDGNVDTVDCGAGADRAVIRAGDIALNCEVVKHPRVARPLAPVRAARSSAGRAALTGANWHRSREAGAKVGVSCARFGDSIEAGWRGGSFIPTQGGARARLAGGVERGAQGSDELGERLAGPPRPARPPGFRRRRRRRARPLRPPPRGSRCRSPREAERR